MADAHHRLSVHSCQDRINSTCHGKYSQACHSLSKSTSSLSNQRASLNKLQELHKSLNNVFCSSRSGRSGFQNSQTATRFWVLDGDSDLCSVEGNCNHVYVDQSKKMIHLQNHHLSADSSLAPIEQKVKSIFFKSKGSENVSLLGCLESSSKAKSNDTIATEQRCFQRSHSDFNCGKVSQDSSTPKILNKNSATYSALCSFSSISDTSCNDMCLNYAPVAVHSSTAIHNNLTAVMDSDEDFNISICHLDSNAMQQSSLVYSVPRQHRHTVLGLVNAGIDLTSNTQIYSQPHSNSPGFLSCENILNSKDSQPTKIIHNNCSLYCVESSKSLAKGDKTVAAYCHSLPIPSVQVSSGPICTPCKSFLGHTHPEFCSLLPPTGDLAFPKLVSSVSESGLDAKKLIQSGQLFFPQLPVSKGELKTKIPVYDRNELLPFTVETSSDYQKVTDLITQKKDMWTMTSKSQLFLECRLPLECRDAEVQTFVIMENKSVSTSPCLKVNSHQCFIPDVALALSAMKEVRWDDEGMTWEVYGASLDPEVLGLAIQKHLEIQIEQNLQPSEEPREIAVNKSLSGKKRSLRTVVHSLRQYSCCCCRSFTAD